MKDSNEEKALINIKNINSNKKMILLIIPLLISITVINFGAETIVSNQTKEENFNKVGESNNEKANTQTLQNEIIDEGEIEKEENVYINLESSGVVDHIYVVNNFLNCAGKDVTDYGTYESVKDLSGLKNLKNENDMIFFSGKSGKNYYQGNLETKEIPWNIEVKYFVDGIEINSNEMAGKSGNIEIKINIKKNPNINQIFFDNYLLQTILSLDTEKCKDIETKGATIANVGKQKQLTFMIIPGEEKEISIKFKTEEFCLEDGISFNGVLMNLSIDSIDTTEIQDKISDLKNGVKKINDGANNLKSGSNEFRDGVNNLASSVAGVPAKSATLADGANKCLAGVREMKSKIASATSSNSPSAENAKNQIMVQVSSMLANPEYSALMSSPEMAGTIQGLLTNVVNQTVDTVSTAYTAGINSSMQDVINGLNSLENGLSSVASGCTSLDNGMSDIVSGINKVSTSYAEIDNGVNEIAKGTNKMNKETKNMDKEVDDTIDEMLEKFESSNFTPISFVSEKNTNISSVQFIIKTEGIEKEEEKEVVEDNKKESNFIEKFVDLF